MKRCILALAVVVAGAVSAQAQAVISPFRPGFSRPPTVSPYLNLGRGGSAGINYFSLVRPQMDVTRSLQALNQQVHSLQSAPAAATVEPAGSPTPTYMYYPHFPTMPSAGVQPLVPRR